MLSDIVLFIHFFLVLLVASGFILFPVGYWVDWRWVRLRWIRLLHIGFMGFVTLEAVVGISCPLTIIENQLRGRETSESFVGYWIRQIFYWDLPADFFMVMYLLCLVWTCYVWKKFPPRGSI